MAMFRSALSKLRGRPMPQPFNICSSLSSGMEDLSKTKLFRASNSNGLRKKIHGLSDRHLQSSSKSLLSQLIYLYIEPRVFPKVPNHQAMLGKGWVVSRQQKNQFSAFISSVTFRISAANYLARPLRKGHGTFANNVKIEKIPYRTGAV